METKNFQATITVNASPAEAMKKISQVKLWWAKDFGGSAKNLGEKFTVRFGETFVDFQISELVPAQKVVWKVMDCNLHWISKKKEWKKTELIFEISEIEGGARIKFRHVGLVPAFECYADCKAGWNGHLKNSLVPLINEGKGAPE